MTLPVPPDKIAGVLRQFFAGLSVPDTKPDATAVHPFMQPLRQPTIGAAAPKSNLPEPMGGAMGMLMSAGPMGERMWREAKDHPVSSIAQAAVLGAMPMMRTARAVAPLVAGAEEARAAGLTADQLVEWRKIEQFLGGANNARRSQNTMTRAMGAANAMQPAVSPMIRAGVEDMAIPVNIKPPGLLSTFP